MDELRIMCCTEQAAFRSGGKGLRPCIYTTNEASRNTVWVLILYCDLDTYIDRLHAHLGGARSHGANWIFTEVTAR